MRPIILRLQNISIQSTSHRPVRKKRQKLYYVIVHLIQQLQAEVEAYKTSLKLEIDSDETPTRWWKNHSTVYPVLASLLNNTFSCVQPVVPRNGSLVHLLI